MLNKYFTSLSPLHEAHEADVKKDEIEDVQEQEPIYQAPYLNTTTMVMEENATKTILTNDLVITGTIQAKSDIDIYGSVIGNIDTEGKLLIKGTVEGDIKARILDFRSPRLNGNITATENVEIKEGSIVVGDIVTKDISVDGSVKGNIKSSGSIVLKGKANVQGDIETGSLEVQKGAIVNGKIIFTNAKPIATDTSHAVQQNPKADKPE